MTYHLESLGWTLVHFCWQAAVIALLYRVADLALVDRRSHLRYVVALGALLSMFAASIATMAYEEAQHRGAAATDGAYTAAAEQPQTSPLELHLAVGVDTKSAPAERSSGLEFSPMLPYLDMLWLAGVVGLSLRFAGGWWMLRRLRRAATLEVPAPVMESLERMRLRIGITRKVVVRLSEEVAGPIALGAFRALVLLPCSALSALSVEELEVVLAHELAHIRRADYLWNMLQMVIETLFFFHPAVWWVGRCVREQRELCCDDIALQVCSSPVVYATALLRLEEQRSNRMHLAMALDGASKVGLRTRIARILGDTGTPPPRQELAPLSLVGLAAALVLFLLPMPQVFASLHPKLSNLHALVGPTNSLVSEPPIDAVDAVKSVTRVVTNASIHTSVKVNAQVAVAPRPPAAPASPAVVPTAPSEPPEVAEPAEAPEPPEAQEAPEVPEAAGTHVGSDYIDAMRAAGYAGDLDQYVAMKIQGVTPEYARQMAQMGMGKPSAGELIALRIQGVSPEYARQMAALGYGKPSIHDLIGMRIQGVTPDYARSMSEMGLGKPTINDLVSMKIQGVSPEYVKGLRDAGIKPANFSDALACRIQGVTPEFARGMAAAGYGTVSSRKLIELRIQGVTPEYARGIKAKFPDATLDNLVQLRIFHIDEAFIASAKQRGFEPITIDKLVRLRISGVMDGAEHTRRAQ